ncbi:putative xanthine dehydrogenase subunit C [Paenibacillus radicis (ex Gao et al. 2016)]|uniref:Xanthine dehydrogenase subunit C n=2 Tax=Paenibacillus radicis (ex Gao et al. 2016) TaxID=1737354 RepID=A0A917M638_9BACL|nr:putative xanthine dehydrogenase subunit C [Paenibacillus radicis (ex Gao et al. 2016)]
MKRLWGATASYTAGGTLLRTQWESGLAPVPAYLIDLSGIAELHGIHDEADGNWRIGPMTTLTSCRSHLGLQTAHPLLTEAVRNIAAPSVRNLATLGGNIVSAVGDALPALLACNSVLQWRTEQGITDQALTEWLEAEQLQSAWKERLLVGIQLPRQTSISQTKRILAYHKVGRREAFTPSVVTVAINGQLGDDGIWRDIRIAAGGGQTRPRRLEHTEALLMENPSNSPSLAVVYQSLLAEFKPKGDSFASADYRRRTAANLIVSELWKAAKRLTEER